MDPLQTPRLTLVPAAPALVRAEMDDRDAFARLLGAEVPAAWPPPLNDRDSMAWVAGLLEAHPDSVGWAAWYFLRRLPDRSVAIGTGGFKGPPSADGTVEVGYSVLEAHQRLGFATEAVGALVEWAFSHAGVRRVVAHTLPDGFASQAVLRKCGFRFLGPGTEEGAVLFERARD